MFLRVAWGSSVVAVPVTPGESTLGRGLSVDAHVRCPDMSRKHLALKVEGTRAWVMDLASTNGTEVRGATIAPEKWVELGFREPFFIGDASLVLLPGIPGEAPRRLMGERVFGSALGEHMEHYQRTSEPFGVCTIHVNAEAEWSDCVVGMLDNADVIGFLSGASARVILKKRNAEEVAIVAAAMQRALARCSISSRVDVRSCPKDGETLAQLLATPGEAPMRDTRKPTGPIMVPSLAMVRVYELVSEVAGTDVSVLVLGETGVGKEVISRTIQQRSQRAEAPFVCLNCAALPEALLESELFGYERGAFSGAVNAKPGLIESADSGTLFLDEIGELPLSTQTKLLRVLETHEVPRLGSLKAKHVDFRLIAATNKNLRGEIAAGRFRADLYYRINGLSITIPPLRERKNELPYLAALFAARAARQLKKNEPFFDREALLALEAYDWPGNVRELKSVVERAVLLCRAGTVLTEHLPNDVLGPSEFDVDDVPTLTLRNGLPDGSGPNQESPKAPTVRSTIPPPARPLPPVFTASGPSPARGSLKEETDRLEYERIVEALQRCQGNQSRAAEALGMTRRALIVRLDRLRIPRPRKADIP